MNPLIEFPITQGHIAFVSEEDADLAELKWQAAKDKQTVYVIRTFWYDDMTRETVRIHRVIMARVLGIELTRLQKVDHVNGNGLDNRRSNLRLVTNVQNTQNRAGQRNTKSGVRGVSWQNNMNSWRARIMVGGRSIELGHYADIKDAAEARRVAELEYFGEFSPLICRKTP